MSILRPKFQAVLLWSLLLGASPLQAQEDKPAPDSGTVTLKLTETLPEDIFAAFTRETGIRFEAGTMNIFDQPQFQRPISITIDHQPVWAALKQVCETTGTNIQKCYGSYHRIILGQHNPDWYQRSMTMTDHFMVTADQVSSARVVNLNEPDKGAQEDITLGYTVYADPKMHLGRIYPQLAIQELTDENGRSLLSEIVPAKEVDIIEVAPNISWAMQANIHLPSQAGKQISKLNGTLQAYIYTKTEKWVVEDILHAKHISKTFGPNTYTIKEIWFGDNGPENRSCSVTVHIESTDPQDLSHPTLVATNRNAYLLDAQGLTWFCYDNSTHTVGTDQHWHFQLGKNTPGFNAKTGDPSRLELEIPIEAEAITIPVNFTNLPLP